MSQPILSICIPTYERNAIVTKQIECLLKEDLRFVEILVSDNNSLDRTYEILIKKFSNSGVKVFKNETNLGTHGNIKKLIERAEGKYLWFLGDDDNIKKGLLEKIVKDLINNEPSIYMMNYAGYDSKKKIINLPLKKRYFLKIGFLNFNKNKKIFFIGDNISRLLFTSANIYKKEMLCDCLPEANYYFANSLLYSMNGIMQGSIYINSDICLLNDDNISWEKEKINVFCEIVKLVGEYKFLNKRQKKNILDIFKAKYLVYLFRKDKLYNRKFVFKNIIGLKTFAYFIFFSLRSLLGKKENKVDTREYYL